MIQSDGWNYEVPYRLDGGDSRKIVTLRQQGFDWVGIRIWNQQLQRWENNGEPIGDEIVAWKDLVTPARGFWDNGKLIIPREGTP